jgi:putative membrane protein
MRLLLNWLVAAVAIMVAAYLLPGVHVDGLCAALVVAIVLGLANALIRPILFILTIPINIITLGLFTLVINGLMVLLAARIVDGFSVSSLGWAVVFSVVLWLINLALRGEQRA